MRGLIVDWGGVLTSSLSSTFQQWAEDDGIDYPHYREVIAELLGPQVVHEAAYNPIHSLERGEMEVADFEIQLAIRLRRSDGEPVNPKGLLERMFNRFEHCPGHEWIGTPSSNARTQDSFALQFVGKYLSSRWLESDV